MLIFEQGDPSYKSVQLTKFFKPHRMTLHDLVNEILTDKNYKYNDWTKACCLYGFKTQPDLFNTKLIEPFSRSENPILKETAVIALEELSD